MATGNRRGKFSLILDDSCDALDREREMMLVEIEIKSGASSRKERTSEKRRLLCATRLKVQTDACCVVSRGMNDSTKLT